MKNEPQTISVNDLLLSLLKQKRRETIGIYLLLFFSTVFFVLSYIYNLGFSLSAYVMILAISTIALVAINTLFNTLLFLAAQMAIHNASIEKTIKLSTASTATAIATLAKNINNTIKE